MERNEEIIAKLSEPGSSVLPKVLAPVPEHSLIEGIVPSTVRCTCGWRPTYNYTARAMEAEWHAHLAG